MPKPFQKSLDTDQIQLFKWQTLFVPLLLTAIGALPPLSIDILLPSLPAIVQQFQAPATRIQLTLTLFLFGLGLTQILYGHLSDRFGRRPILLVGLSLYAIAGATCLAANSVFLLILGRLIQGFAAGCGPSISAAVIRDIYGQARTARILSYTSAIRPLAPIFAPILGGILFSYFGWRSVFFILSIMGLLFFLAYLFTIPETNFRKDPNALKLIHLRTNYACLLNDRQFLVYAFIIAIMFCGQFAFISNSAFIFIHVLNVSPMHYSIYFGCVSCGTIAGAFLAGYLEPRFGIQQLIRVGAFISLCGGLTLFILAKMDHFSIITIVLPMCATSLGGGMVRPLATAGAIVPYSRMTGLASAFVGFLMMSISSLFNIILSFFLDGTPNPMITGIALTSFTAFLISRIIHQESSE